MDKRKCRAYVFWIIAAEAAGILSGLLSMGGMEVFDQIAVKPDFMPPGWVFPVAWSILFALMGIAAARVTLSGGDGSKAALNLFIAQLIVNFFWPLLFFNGQAYGLALIWLLFLWFLVFVLTIRFFRIDRTAGLLLLPYLVWLTFAAVLNYAVFMLN